MVPHRILTGMLLACVLATPLGTASPGLKKGVFLVATDQIQEANFHHAVVLLLTYGDGGAVGIIINRPSRLPVERLLPDLEVPGGDRITIWEGGPVDPGRMLYLVRSEKELAGAARAFGDVHVSHDRNLLNRVLKKKKFRGRYRIIAGYAGWAPGQLEGEIQRGGWSVVPATADQVFTDDPLGLWEKLDPGTGPYRTTGLDSECRWRYSCSTGSERSSRPPDSSPNRIASSSM